MLNHLCHGRNNTTPNFFYFHIELLAVRLSLLFIFSTFSPVKRQRCSSKSTCIGDQVFHPQPHLRKPTCPFSTPFPEKLGRACNTKSDYYKLLIHPFRTQFLHVVQNLETTWDSHNQSALDVYVKAGSLGVTILGPPLPIRWVQLLNIASP